MIARASRILLVAYLLVVATGLVFLTTPSPSLVSIAGYAVTLKLWALFYLVGGLTSSTAVIVRKRARNTAPLWYFEIAGISLIIAANLIYAYALYRTGLATEEYQVYGAAVLVVALSVVLFHVAWETVKHVRTLKQYSLWGASA